MLLKKVAYNAQIKNIEDKIPNITNLATNTTRNANINEAKGEIPSITNLATTAALNAKTNEVKGKIPSITNLVNTTVLIAVENKIPIVSNLVKVNKIEINEIEKEITDYDHSNKYITTQKCNKLTAQMFAARLAQANLASKYDIAGLVKKTDFDDKLKNLNKSITSNKTKNVLVENELEILQTFDSNSNFCIVFKGSGLKQKTATYTPPTKINFFIVYELGIWS